MKVLERVYDYDAYFRAHPRCQQTSKRPSHAVKGQLQSLPVDLYRLGRVIWMMPVRHPELRKAFWKTFFDCVLHNPAALKSVIGMMALYLHFGPFSRDVIGRIRAQIAEIDAGSWVSPPLVPVPEVPAPQPKGSRFSSYRPAAAAH